MQQNLHFARKKKINGTPELGKSLWIMAKRFLARLVFFISFFFFFRFFLQAFQHRKYITNVSFRLVWNFISAVCRAGLSDHWTLSETTVSDSKQQCRFTAKCVPPVYDANSGLTRWHFKKLAACHSNHSKPPKSQLYFWCMERSNWQQIRRNHFLFWTYSGQTVFTSFLQVHLGKTARPQRATARHGLWEIAAWLRSPSEINPQIAAASHLSTVVTATKEIIQFLQENSGAI